MTPLVKAEAPAFPEPVRGRRRGTFPRLSAPIVGLAVYLPLARCSRPETDVYARRGSWR